MAVQSVKKLKFCIRKKILNMGRKIVGNYFRVPTKVVGAVRPNRHNRNADMVGIGKGACLGQQGRRVKKSEGV